MKIELYTTHCPMCKGVERMLKIKKVNYEEVEGEEPIRNMGFRSAPVLVVDGVPHVGSDIFTWINGYHSENKE